MKLSVSGALVAAMTVLKNGQAIQCKDVVVSDLSTGDLFAARAKAKDGEYWALHELATKCELIDSDGDRHQMTYEMLHDTSSSNFKKLEDLDLELRLKLNAASLESLSS